MSLLQRLFSITAISLFSLSIAVSQTTHTWIGGSGNWSDTNHWDSGIVPAAQDNVLITGNGTYTVTLDMNATINDFTIGANSGTQFLSITSRTLTINGTATINDSGEVNLVNSTLNGTGTLSNYGTLSMIIGAIGLPFENAGFASFSRACSINNTLTTQTGSTLRVYTEHYTIANLTVANGFTNNGLLQMTTVYQNAYSAVTVTNGTLLNAPGATIEVNQADYANQLNAELDNQGSLILNDDLTINKASATHNNSGTITVSGGNLTLTQTGTNPSFSNTGTLTVESSRTLTVNGGAFDHSSGSFMLSGVFTANNSSINFTPSFVNTAIMNLTSSTLTCDAPFTNQGELNLVITTINGSGSLTNEDSLSMIIGAIDLPFENAGFASFSRACSINNTLTAQTGSTLRVYTEHYTIANLTVANGFTNNGLLQMTTVYQNAYSAVTVTNGTLLNAPGATIEVNQADYANQLNAELDNRGTLKINHSLTVNKASAAHHNSGIINVHGSNKVLKFMGTSFSNDSSGVLTGYGTVDVTSILCTNPGSINPGDSLGSLRISGNLPQETNSSINIEIGGLIPDSLYDRLDIDGIANLEGTLNINPVNNYMPNAGETFRIMNFNSRVDTFRIVNGLQLGSCKFFTLEYSDTAVTLVVNEISGTSPPVANPDSLTMFQDTLMLANILSNDMDPDNDPLILVSLGIPQHGTAVITGDSTIMYLPDSGFVGTDMFTYTMRDLPGCLASSLVTIRIDSALTDINHHSIFAEIPKHYALEQNYPNPFNPSTTIVFDIPKAGLVTLKVYNILGEEVSTVVSDKLSAGTHRYRWEAGNLASGIYIYQLNSGNFSQTRKMILMR